MKLNNKILYLTATGVISTLIPANTNAQTFYQCMPITCKAGEYKENNTCKKCPAGTYNPNTGSLTSADCKPCSAGYYSVTGASSCKPCEAGYFCPGNSDRKACSSGTYTSSGSASSCKKCSDSLYTQYTGDKYCCGYASDGRNCIKYCNEYKSSFSINDKVRTPIILAGCAYVGRDYIRKEFSAGGCAIEYLGCNPSTGYAKVKIYKDCGETKTSGASGHDVYISEGFYCNANKTEEQDID